MGEKNQEEKPAAPVVSSDEAALEQTLIEAAQDGDKRAFGQLVRKHQKRLFRFVYGLLGSFDAAEDVVQTAFIKAWGSIERFKLGFAFYPWLARIARNTAYNLIAREEKKESLDKLTEAGFDPDSAELGPLERLMDNENQRRFQKALKALPAKYRAVFACRHLEDMSYTEIASFLKIPPGTVDSRLHRARQMLMDSLADLL